MNDVELVQHVVDSLDTGLPERPDLTPLRAAGTGSDAAAASGGPPAPARPRVRSSYPRCCSPAAVRRPPSPPTRPPTPPGRGRPPPVPPGELAGRSSASACETRSSRRSRVPRSGPSASATIGGSPTTSMPTLERPRPGPVGDPLPLVPGLRAAGRWAPRRGRPSHLVPPSPHRVPGPDAVQRSTLPVPSQLRGHGRRSTAGRGQRRHPVRRQRSLGPPGRRLLLRRDPRHGRARGAEYVRRTRSRGRKRATRCPRPTT